MREWAPSAALLALAACAAILLAQGCGRKNDAVLNPQVAPTADFNAAPRSGIRPLDVDFTDQSVSGSSPITSWLWSFGDGTTSTSRNPGHPYATAGRYAVSLTVATASGSNMRRQADYIVVVSDSAGTAPPTAQFSGSPTSGRTPLTVQFTDQSTPGTATITSWQWTFGDGGTSTARNPSHTYTGAGSYTVSLTVTTSAGQDTQTKASYVNASSSVVPTAQFSGSPTTGPAPLTVRFSDQSTAGSSQITAWLWSFGDGSTSTAQDPSHVYTAAGSYTVSLRVATSAGQNTQTKTNYVAVSSPVPPTAEFSGSPTNGSAPLAVQFTDQSTAGSAPTTSWSWAFGDGGTSTVQNPRHTYTAAGSHTVRLIVASSAGRDTLSRAGYIGVLAAPTAGFGAAPRSGASPLAVQFTDQSTAGSAPITSWSWSFGDGGTSTEQNPLHTYIDAGSYTVRLIVGSSAGSDTLSRMSYIAACAPPTADFSASPTSGLTLLAAQFTDRSTPGNSPITSWSWDFGDGGTSAEQNPTHVYLLPGRYDVSLTVGTACGKATATKAGYITVGL